MKLANQLLCLCLGAFLLSACAYAAITYDPTESLAQTEESVYVADSQAVPLSSRRLLQDVLAPTLRNLVVGTEGGSKVKQVNGGKGKSGQVNVASAVDIPDYYEGSQSKSLTRSEQPRKRDPKKENYATSYGDGMAGLECSNEAIGEDGAAVDGRCLQYATSYQQSLAKYDHEDGGTAAANGGGKGENKEEGRYSHKGSTSGNIQLAKTFEETDTSVAGGYSYGTTGRANSKKKLLKSAGLQSEFDKYTVKKETEAVLEEFEPPPLIVIDLPLGSLPGGFGPLPGGK